MSLLDRREDVLTILVGLVLLLAMGAAGGWLLGRLFRGRLDRAGYPRLSTAVARLRGVAEALIVAWIADVVVANAWAPAPPVGFGWLPGLLWLAVLVLATFLAVALWRPLARDHLTLVDQRRGTELARQVGPLVEAAGVVFLLFCAAVIALDHYHVNIQAFLATAGIASLAVALAAQESLANLFAGFTLMLDRPFRLHDPVTLASGESGTVLEIGLRSTKLVTREHTVLIIPNKVLAQAIIANQAYPDRQARVERSFAFGRDADPAAVREALLAAAAAVPAILQEPPPAVYFTALDPSGLHASVVATVADYTEAPAAGSALVEAALVEVRRRGLPLA
jgi:MscS family membrane protein